MFMKEEKEWGKIIGYENLMVIEMRGEREMIILKLNHKLL